LGADFAVMPQVIKDGEVVAPFLVGVDEFLKHLEVFGVASFLQVSFDHFGVFAYEFNV
jgi:hypothetical protein